MAYQRKTEDEYELLYDYGCGQEVISRCSTYAEARKDKAAYIENEHICPTIKKRRVKRRIAV